MNESYMFARVKLDAEEWERHIEVTEKQVKARRIKGWKPPPAFEWQWDKKVYSVKPGESITVPLEAAEAGFKKSHVFPRERDEHGNELMVLDHNGSQIPMLEIEERYNALDQGIDATPQVPISQAPKCPFCHEEVSDLADHLQGECSKGSFGTSSEDSMTKNLEKAMEAMNA